MAINQFGGTYSGDLPNGGNQVIDLVATTGGEVKFEITRPKGVLQDLPPMQFNLLDAAGKVIATLTTTGNGELLATVPSAGNYTLQVRDAGGSSGPLGAYSVETQLTYRPHVTYDGGVNDTMETALDSPLGDQIVGRLEEGDTDVFRIQPDAAGVLTLHFAHPHGAGMAGMPIQISVVDALGQVVTSKTFVGDATFVTTVDAAGDYYVRVQDPHPYWPNSPGLYGLIPALTHLPGVVYDGAANDTPAAALALDPGQTAIGSLETGDQDYFRFEAGAGGTLVMNFLHPDGEGNSGTGLCIQIVDGSGRQVVTANEHGDDVLTAELTNGGTYYVRMASDANKPTDPGLYKFMLGLAGDGGRVIESTGPAPFSGTAGNDVVKGSTGRDTMQYAGDAAGYEIEVSPAGATVLDTSGKAGFDTLFKVERLQFDDKAVALDVDGDAGSMFRLYQAAFDRAPDESGLGFWLDTLDHGTQMHAVAQGFIASREFHDLYGDDLSNRQFVDAIYTNVLHRAPDRTGEDFWTQVLDQNQTDRPDVLVAVANSDENVAQVIGATLHGIAYLPWHG